MVICGIHIVYIYVYMFACMYIILCKKEKDVKQQTFWYTYCIHIRIYVCMHVYNPLYGRKGCKTTNSRVKQKGPFK